MNSTGFIKLMMTSALPVTQMTSRLAVPSKCPPSRRGKDVSQRTLRPSCGEGGAIGTAQLRQQ